jgi:hypothetical protein
VKIKGLTPQDGQSPFCVEPFHKGLVADSRKFVRRRITRDAGRGLEKLGHALEYLIDEFVHDGCRFDEDNGRLQAIQLLASLNRQIYFECGIEPSLRERVHAVFRRLFHQPSLGN